MRTIAEEKIVEYKTNLIAEEKSANTIQKYLRDLGHFQLFAGDRSITKELTIAYKIYLKEHYRTTSANSMLAALNSFLKWAGWADCTVKPFKVQRADFREAGKELSFSEYARLLDVAKRRRQMWLYYIKTPF